MLVSCKKDKLPQLSFYFWKTSFRLTDAEKNTLNENNVKKLYVRYFDVDLDSKTDEPYPNSAIKFYQNPKEFIIIPVVFIKNKVFLSKTVDIDLLSIKIIDFISQINNKNNIKISEVQFDCDWSVNSKDNFLEFIKLVGKKSKIKISATIRLHQVKYFKKLGVPNAYSGVLMYYNMGSISALKGNSIYSKESAKNYLSSLKNYPLELKVALPIFSWAIHIRDRKIVSLRNKINFKELKKDRNFTKVEEGFYKVLNSNYKEGIFYLKGDILKLELITSENLMEMTSDLSENLKHTPSEIIIYDLDNLNTKNYKNDIFSKIIKNF